MIDPHKEKYHGLYWTMALAAARESVAIRAKVGAVVVTPTGMISVGWNGMPPGLPNRCENTWLHEPGAAPRRKTDPRVIHAERNAIDKMTRQGVPVEGSLLFCTLSPCIECAKALSGLGFKKLYFRQRHDCIEGLRLFDDLRVPWAVMQP